MTYIGDFVAQLNDELALLFGYWVHEVVSGAFSCLIDLHLPHLYEVEDGPDNTENTAENDDDNGGGVVKSSPALRTVCRHGVD